MKHRTVKSVKKKLLINGTKRDISYNRVSEENW